jgi:hypothetical protein
MVLFDETVTINSKEVIRQRQNTDITSPCCYTLSSLDASVLLGTWLFKMFTKRV